ncbi:MAG TPA: hypothetical protein DCM87_01125 [Planctomycetes bacterium]|nr:hypothetical protein [Planctomycetota bacterium]
MADTQLIEKLRRAAAVFEGTGVLAAYAFGSRITGRPRPDSDCDVGYFRELSAAPDPLPFREEMRLADVLSQAAGVEVDLRDLSDAPLEARGRAVEEGVRLFSGDDVRRVGLERDLLARYHDYKDAFRHMHELRLRSGAGRRTH